MPELLLHHAQALRAPKQFRTARVTKRVRMQRGYPSPSAGGPGDFPNPLTRSPTLDGLTSFVRVRDHEEWSRTGRVRSLGRHVVAKDHARPRRQGYRNLVPTFADDPTKSEVRGDITHIQRCNFTATKPSAGHEGEDCALSEIAVTQERLDCIPGRHGWNPCPFDADVSADPPDCEQACRGGPSTSRNSRARPRAAESFQS